MKKIIDLNCDMGEAFGNYAFGADLEIIQSISSANIACAYHAGDPLVMDARVKLCREHQVAVGAHPSFPDLMGFGRRPMAATPAEVKAYVIYQLGALLGFAQAHGVKVEHVKPHGALYNMAALDEKLARAIAEGIYMVDPQCILVGLAGTALCSVGRAVGLPVAEEVFADRGYRPDGTLVPRGEPGAIIKSTEEAVERIVRLVETGTIVANNGQAMQVKGDTVCLHGDTPGAAEYAKAIRQRLESQGVLVRPMREVIAG